MAFDAVHVTPAGGGDGITGGTVTNATTGSGDPFANIPHYLPLNYIISVQGSYPQHS